MGFNTTMLAGINKIPYHKCDYNIKQNSPNTKTNLRGANSNIKFQNITPTYNVKITQSYQTFPVQVLPNGQEIHPFKLSNGQKVIIAPMNTPTTYISTIVNSGGINETKENKGINHLIEHLLFNNADGKDIIHEELKKIGGNAEAYTAHNQITYTFKSPQFDENDLETNIKLQAKMLQNPTFSLKNVEKEKQIIKSEINLYNDIPDKTSINLGIKNLYNLCSDSKDLITGNKSDIEKISIKQINEYHKKNYTPNSMTTVITGNVNPQHTINLISKYFNASPSINNIQPTPLIPINKTVRQDFISLTEETYTSGLINYEGPQNNDIKSKIATRLALELLNNSSNDINANLLTLNNEKNGKQLISITYKTNNSNPENDLKQIMTTLNNFGNFTTQDLNKSKTFLKSDYFEKLEEPQSLNTILAKNQSSIFSGDYPKYDSIFENMTIDDIKNITSKYFSNSKSIIITHPKMSTKEKITQNYNLANPNISFKSNIKHIDLSAIETNKLNNNIEIAYYDKPTAYNTNINIYIKPDKNINNKIGQREIMNSILDSVQTENFAITQYKQNSFININNGINITAITNTENIQNLCDFVTSIMDIDEELTSEIVEEHKNKLKEKLKNNNDSSIEITENELLKYPNKNTINANIDNINLEDIKKYWSDIIENSSITIALCGPKTKIKEPTINHFNKFGSVKNNNKQLTNIYEKNSSTKIISNISERNQAEICQGNSYKITGNLKDEVSFELFESLLKTKIHNNVREKNKLAYFIDVTNSTNGNLRTTFCIAKSDITNSSENIKNTINCFTNEINSIKTGNIDNDELSFTKKMLKHEILENSYRQEDITYNLLNGINSPYGMEYLNKKLDMIDEIKKEDIIKVVNYIYKDKPVYTILAPKESLDANTTFFNNLSKN